MLLPLLLESDLIEKYGKLMNHNCIEFWKIFYYGNQSRQSEMIKPRS